MRNNTDTVRALIDALITAADGRALFDCMDVDEALGLPVSATWGDTAAALRALLPAEGTPPPADPGLLAAGNRALHEQLQAASSALQVMGGLETPDPDLPIATAIRIVRSYHEALIRERTEQRGVLRAQLADMTAERDRLEGQVHAMAEERAACLAAIPLGDDTGTLPTAFRRVCAKRDRLARILAVERGDESAAPEGWRLSRSWDRTRWRRDNPGFRVWLDADENCWFAKRITEPCGPTVIVDGRWPTAIEAMEAPVVSDG